MRTVQSSRPPIHHHTTLDKPEFEVLSPESKSWVRSLNRNLFFLLLLVYLVWLLYDTLIIISSELAFNSKHCPFLLICITVIVKKSQLVINISSALQWKEDVVDNIGAYCPKNPQDHTYCYQYKGAHHNKSWKVFIKKHSF